MFADRGVLLVTFIVVISAVLLGLVGITFYLTEHLRTTSLRQNQTRAIYLAQAGIMRELYDYRRGAEVSLSQVSITAGPPGGIAGDDIYEIDGPDADFLLVNMRANIPFPFPTPNLCPAGAGGQPRDQLTGWFLRNVLASGEPNITIDQIKVDWSPVSGEGILQIALNGNIIWTASPGCAAWPRDTFLNVPDQGLAAAARWGNNRIWFTSTTMDAKDWIDITFRMADGSERRSHWHRVTVADRSADFTLRSQGTVRRGVFPFEVWRRLRAEYRICRSVSGTNCDAIGEEQTQEGKLIGYGELTTLSP